MNARNFRAIWLPRGSGMKSLADTPHRDHPIDVPDALREAARAILDEGGPDTVGLQETARRVGVSAAAAYRHFTEHP